MNKIITEYTWSELIANAYEELIPLATNSFFDVFDDIFPSDAFVFKDSEHLKDYLEDLYNLLYKRYYDWYCAQLDGCNITPQDETLAYQKFMLKVSNITQMTYDKYAARIGIFATAKNSLMAQVKGNTTAKTGYNDTPQNEDSGGFEDATHRTSFTKVTSDTATDGATPIERIDEIDRKIKNIMLEWCQEFKDLFWSE